MSGKSKFLLISLFMGICFAGIGWIGLIRFGMGAELAAVFMYLGNLIIEISLLLGIIFLVGFKRFIKWVYFLFVVSFVVTVILIVPFLDLVTILITGGIALVLALTLIPIFKKS